ncbi:MAG: XRE family transcriptional regulator [Sphingomonadales bacterium]|nr:XRE family transcriptional regulator [Sphingomonadales bacterium]
MTPAQSRMARAALEWTIDYAPKKAGVPRMAIMRFESSQTIAGDARDALRRAYEGAGVEVVTDGAAAHSVRFVGAAASDPQPGTLRVV